MSSIPISELLRLSARDRLRIVEAIWDSLAADPASVPVPASHIKELKRRAADFDSGGEVNTVDWNDAKAQARKKLGS